jgi:SAM-dependent methyltransferase
LRDPDAHVYSAESLPFLEAFDAIFSNALLHWMLDVQAESSSVDRALRSGGRFVADMGGASTT